MRRVRGWVGRGTMADVRWPVLRFPLPESRTGVLGPARVDRRTKRLTKRLRPGDVAVIDHTDIDKVSAEALVACRPSAVVNAARSISGRYPNVGPGIIVDAGIPLFDEAGADLLDVLADGMSVHVDERGGVHVGEDLVASAAPLDKETVTAAMEEARQGLSGQLEAFVTNTLDYLEKDKDLLFDGVGLPRITTVLDGRPVLIVVRGYHYKEDLATLRPFIRENKPVMIGVDGGADALLDVGYRPHMIVGDMDSVTDRALACGAEIVVHAYRDGRAPGAARVADLGLPHVVFPATGTSEDVAMLLADDAGASVIVAVGTHNTLEDFLDKGRAGMASTFLTRLRVGGKLVDAKGVSRLYRSRISNVQVGVLVVAGLLSLLAALWATSAGRAIVSIGWARVDDLVSWVTHLPEALLP